MVVAAAVGLSNVLNSWHRWACCWKIDVVGLSRCCWLCPSLGGASRRGAEVQTACLQAAPVMRGSWHSSPPRPGSASSICLWFSATCPGWPISYTGSGISHCWLVVRTDRSALNWEGSCQRWVILVNQHKTAAKSDNVVTHCMLLLFSMSFAALGVHSIKRLHKLVVCKSLWLLFNSHRHKTWLHICMTLLAWS